MQLLRTHGDRAGLWGFALFAPFAVKILKVPGTRLEHETAVPER